MTGYSLKQKLPRRESLTVFCVQQDPTCMSAIRNEADLRQCELLRPLWVDFGHSEDTRDIGIVVKAHEPRQQRWQNAADLARIILGKAGGIT